MEIRTHSDGDSVWEKFRALLREERGAVVVFSMIVFTMMLLIAGIATDLAYAEYRRALIQETADRAALAAAKLDQSLDPEAVVIDYFEKANLAEHLVSVTVRENTPSVREVAVEASETIKTYIAHLAGLDQLNVSARSTATNAIGDTEISLVLDVSSSMYLDGRIVQLRRAGREFVDNIYANSQATPGDSLVSITIVPYNSTVNLGPALAGQYRLDRTHDHSFCPTLRGESFSDTSIDPGVEYGISPHMQRYWAYLPDRPYMERSQCRSEPPTQNQIEPFVTDPDRAKEIIGSLREGGNTAIDLGMKWGVAFLDQATRSVTAGLIAENLVHPSVAGRPAAFGATGTGKFIILMTDGDNTEQYDLDEPYKSGMSDVWVYRGDNPGRALKNVPLNRFSIRLPNQNPADPDRFFRLESGTDQHNLPVPYAPEGETAERLAWTEIYATWMTKAIGEVLFREAADTTTEINESHVSEAHDAVIDYGGYVADTRLSRLCSVAREAGIIIYSVAFESSSRGQRVLRDCASSDAHYFDVSGPEIVSAFVTIARDIRQKLRLVQ